MAFTLVVWRDPGGARALFDALRRAIEATLLAELSRPASELHEEGDRHVVALRLVCFAAIEDAETACRAFGLRRAESADLPRTIAQVHGEASRLGFDAPDEPTMVFESKFASNDSGLEGELREILDKDVFGQRPGAFFAALNQVREQGEQDALPPRIDSLDVLEDALVPSQEGVVRWVAPTSFQALCDAVAVCVRGELGRKVEWAVSELEDDGLAPPPMLRLREGPAYAHVPLGLDLMRWCVMPRAKGESIPTLAEWARDRFATAS